MEIRLNDDQVLRLRLRAQRLTSAAHPEAAASVEKVLADLCGTQAQDLAAGILSAGVREPGLTEAEVAQAREEQHRIVQIWCMRGTLHLIPCSDARWLIPLLGPIFIQADRRRAAQLGWEQEQAARGLQLLREALQDPAGLTRAEIIQLLEDNHLPSAGQAPIHLIFRAAFEGILCPGPKKGNQQRYMPFETWIGKPEHLPREKAMAELTRRYLQAYAPASPEDMASWSGLKIGDARAGWQALAGELIQVQAPSQALWLLKTQLSGLDSLPPGPIVRLLPRFDTYLLGYANRDRVISALDARQIYPGGGLIHPALIADGRALGTWKTKRQRASLEVTVQPFARLDDALLPELEAQAAALGHFYAIQAALKLLPPLRHE